MRLAFITPEYPSEAGWVGGLGNYLHRFARLCLSARIDVEVFVPNRDCEQTSYQGVTVHRVNWENELPAWAVNLRRRGEQISRSPTYRASTLWLCQAWALTKALERRHATAPFQVVQSAATYGVGMFLRKRPGRVHAVRCSSAVDLWAGFDGTYGRKERVRGLMERAAIRKADFAYAPSAFLADYFRRRHGLSVAVLPPPLFQEYDAALDLSVVVPERFLLHFGQLMPRKGTRLIAEALPLAWAKAPDLHMVWVGPCWNKNELQTWRESWGAFTEQVTIADALPKPEIYTLLKRADAAVLPSQVDNLPNTVIESLMLGVPVIGSRGASIDELVEDRKTGHLVPLGDPAALADAMVTVWQGRSSVAKGFRWSSHLAEQMSPENALSGLFAVSLEDPRVAGVLRNS